MFKWLNKQGVEKEAEFTLQRVDRFHYDYTEDGMNMQIVVEADSKKENIYVSDALEKLAAFDGKRVTDNIAEALGFMGVRFKIH
jgi:hypothetical protein